MRNCAIDRKASDPDQMDPERAAVSVRAIAAAWLLVLAAGLVALLPSALDIAEAAMVRTAYLARSEITEVLPRLPNVPQPHDLTPSQMPDAADILGNGGNGQL